MPSGLTINVSAATSALVPTNASQSARGALPTPPPQPNQLAIASQAAAEKATLSLKRRDETAQAQTPPRAEATYGLQKRKAKKEDGDSEDEANEDKVEEGEHKRVDLKA